MGAKSDNFCLFSAYLGVFCPDLWMKYRIFISIVDISANLENIDIDIDIDKKLVFLADLIKKTGLLLLKTKLRQYLQTQEPKDQIQKVKNQKYKSQMVEYKVI